jgi:AraC-like DNA-binding protein/mannose-6-phosphate isomerase-like protein (cupin superfamily)
MTSSTKVTHHAMAARARNPLPDLRMIAVGSVLGKTWANTVHHDDNNIVWIMAGEGRVRIDDREFTVSAGDFFLVPVGARSRFSPSAEWDEYLVSCIGRRVDTWLSGDLLPAVGKARSLPEGSLPQWRRELEAIVGLASVEDPDTGPRLVNRVENVLIEQDAAIRRNAGAAHRAQISEILAYMQSDPVGCGGPQDVAEHFQLSYSHFRRLFRQQTGASPGHRLTELRCEYARRLLRETDAPIKQVAAESGFGSFAAFCRTFRQLTGQTPRGYRKSMWQTPTDALRRADRV